MTTTENPLFFRAFMTSVFAGLAATITAVIFDMVGAQVFYFPLSFLNNVSTLIFSVNILFPILGVLYYGCLKLSNKGDLIFITICTVITVYYAVKAWGMQATANPVLNLQIRDLFTGITLILGIFAALAIPVCFHSEKFERTVV